MSAVAHKAFALARLGVASFPVYVECRPDGSYSKRPLTVHGHHDATTDSHAIALWEYDYPTANAVGVPTGANGIAVLDIDRHPGGSDGFVTLAELGLMPPATASYETAGGGRHHVYAAPAGADLTSGELFPGVDVKAGSSWVVWHGDAPDAWAFSPAPEWALRRRIDRAPAPDADISAWVLDNPGHPEGELARRLASLPPYGSPEWRNDRLVALAMPLVSAAEWDKGGGAARQAFIDAYAAGEWCDGDHRADAERAFDRAIANAGVPHRGGLPDIEVNWSALDPEAWATLHPVVAAAEVIAREAAAPRRKALGELMAREFTPLDWVVPGVIPEGVTLLVAPPKAGKSWLALDVALAAATGGQAFGSIPVGVARPVLYLDLESGERRLQSRVQAQGWRQFGGFEYHLDRTSALDEAASFVQEHASERPLVIIDTLAAVQADRPKERTQYQHDYESLAQFQRFTRATPGAGVFIVHHTRKAVTGDPMEAVSGTNGLAGAVDTPMVLVRPDRHRPEGELNVMPRDFEGGEFALRFEGCRWVVDGHGLRESVAILAERAMGARKSRLGPVAQGILAVVESDPGREWAADEIVTLYGGESPTSTVRQNLSRMVRSGTLASPSRGVYQAAA